MSEPLSAQSAPPRSRLPVIAAIVAVLLLCACVVILGLVGGGGLLLSSPEFAGLFATPTRTPRPTRTPEPTPTETPTPIATATPEETATPEAQPPEVEEFPIQEPVHVDEDESHEPYNSDPPTSGPHYDQTVEAGVYLEQIPDEYLVHNLEHGYVIIWYDCTALSEDECAELVAGMLNVFEAFDGYKVIGVPRLGMPTPIALTSWGRLARLETWDEAFVIDFIETYQNQAPEPDAP